MRSDALHQFHIAMVYGSYDRDLDHDLGSAALNCICGLHWDYQPFRHTPCFQTRFSALYIAWLESVDLPVLERDILDVIGRAGCTEQAGYVQINFSFCIR